jgi:polysaccharide biosynthesis transport protein
MQRQTLGEELRQLAPVARSPWVSNLVDKLSGPASGGPPPGSPPLNDPPLLLVRVYQDSMVDLFKLNSDLAGARAVEVDQMSQLGIATEKLNALTKNAQQFVQLQRRVNQAAANADNAAKRMEEEQISDASNVARLSSLSVVHPATVPQRPVFPRYPLALAAALLASLVGSAALVIMIDTLQQKKELQVALERIS